MPSFPVSARTFNVGDNLFGPANIPIGSNKGTLILDVAAMGPPEARTVPGQRFGIIVDYFDGVQWQNLGFSFEIEGPWYDKAINGGALHNEITVGFGFGSIAIDGGPLIPRVSAAGWKVRATIRMTVAPLDSAGGTLVLT